MAWSVVTVIPISTGAQPANFRPEVELNGERTPLLVDQIRAIDTTYIFGEPVRHLSYSEMQQVEDALSHYLGLSSTWRIRGDAVNVTGSTRVSLEVSAPACPVWREQP